jgi:hypothetical protein
MLTMSFYNGTLDREKAKQIILASEKPCKYTYGLGYRGPTTNNKPISKEEAMKIIDTQSLLDITERENDFHLNAYSDNDMW